MNGFSVAEQLVRFGVIAQKLGIDVGGIAQAMPLLGAEVRGVEIGMSASGEQLATSTLAPREADWPERVGQLARACGVDPAPVARLFAARPARNVRLELATTGQASGVAATVRWLDAAPLEHDVACSRLAGVPDTALRALAQRIDSVGSDSVSQGLAMRIAPGEPLEVGIALEVSSDLTTTARLVALGTELGIGEPQRALLERVHPVLGAEGAAILEVWTQARGIRAELAITYDAKRWTTRDWDTALRVVTGLHPGAEAARRVGTFEGALDGAHVTRISIDWSASDPPPAWVWAAR